MTRRVLLSAVAAAAVLWPAAALSAALPAPRGPLPDIPAVEGAPVPDAAQDELAALYEELGRGGWTDAELVRFHGALRDAGRLESGAASLRAAIGDPSLPEEERPRAFYDALAWYFAGGEGSDGSLSPGELQSWTDTLAGEYERLLGQGRQADEDRLRTWKMLQKAVLIRVRRMPGGRDYRHPPFRDVRQDPAQMEWSAAHTLRTVAEFEERVCRASQAKPVLVKFGFTGCADCLLLELLGSVKAVAERHPEIEVYKSWWGNAPAEMNDLKDKEGVRGSPFFILYDEGARYRCGYAFPDETGSDESLEACLSRTSPAGRTPAGACLDWR